MEPTFDEDLGLFSILPPHSGIEICLEPEVYTDNDNWIYTATAQELIDRALFRFCVYDLDGKLLAPKKHNLPFKECLLKLHEYEPLDKVATPMIQLA